MLAIGFWLFRADGVLTARAAGEAVGGSSAASPSVRIEVLFEDNSEVPSGVVLKGMSVSPDLEQAFSTFELADWQRVFSVAVVPKAGLATDSLPAMAGRYVYADGELVFNPLFVFEPGVGYQATFRSSVLELRLRRRGLELGKALSGASDPITLRFQPEALDDVSTTALEVIFPTASVLPENLLKFYLQFSAPMSIGTGYRHVHLYREDGSEVSYPFLQLDEELWDPSGQRMTILIDPGRIKNGLLPKSEIGPSLEEGKRFRFVVDGDWPDEAGRPLVSRVEKWFKVTLPDTVAPSMSSWELKLPAIGSSEPLEVVFPEPMDRALLQRVVWIEDASGNEVTGTIQISEQETKWRLRPDVPWQSKIYTLCAENSLEDLAGNSLGRLFEVDSFLTVSQRVNREIIRRAFQPKTSR